MMCIAQVIFIIFSLSIYCYAAEITSKSILVAAKDEQLRDPEGFKAIVQLHHQMDDDRSGSIDRLESTGFLKEDMNFGGSERVEREQAFHHNNDESITVDDLWESWFASEERTWTTLQMVDWMENAVRLPQYTRILTEYKVDGRALPRMAVTNSSYLMIDLNVKNHAHKRKIRLKALDVVLFGFIPEKSSRMKDIALSILLIVLITVLLIFKRQRNRSSREVEQLNSKLSQLKSMQSDFEDAQNKFDKEAKCRRASETEHQMQTLKIQLLEAERLLESNNSAPLALQPLLKRTYELEISYIGQQRMECISEMRDAIEHIDKLRKKQSSLMSSIKLATGASIGIDHIDSHIYSLKARMEKISLSMSECYQRWMEIESLCGFPLYLLAEGAFTEHLFSSQKLTAVRLLPRIASTNSPHLINSGSSSISSTGKDFLATSSPSNVPAPLNGTHSALQTHCPLAPLGSPQTEHQSSIKANLEGNVQQHQYIDSMQNVRKKMKSHASMSSLNSGVSNDDENSLHMRLDVSTPQSVQKKHKITNIFRKTKA